MAPLPIRLAALCIAVQSSCTGSSGQRSVTVLAPAVAYQLSKPVAVLAQLEHLVALGIDLRRNRVRHLDYATDAHESRQSDRGAIRIV